MRFGVHTLTSSLLVGTFIFGSLFATALTVPCSHAIDYDEGPEPSRYRAETAKTP